MNHILIVVLGSGLGLVGRLGLGSPQWDTSSASGIQDATLARVGIGYICTWRSDQHRRRLHTWGLASGRMVAWLLGMVGAGRLDGPGMNPSLLMYVLASLVIVPRAVLSTVLSVGLWKINRTKTQIFGMADSKRIYIYKISSKAYIFAKII